MHDLDEIRSRISLIALAEEAGAKFSDAHRLRSHCPLPLHAGDSSSLAFIIYDDGRKWKCHSSCPSNANGGDVIAFYMAWKGVDFKTAVQELSEWIGSTHLPQPVPAPKLKQWIQPQQWTIRAKRFVSFAEENLRNDKRTQEYLRIERGLSPETWRAFRVGYNPKNIYDDPAKWGLDGKKIWLSRGIVIPGFQQGKPRYIKIRRPMRDDALEKYIGKWTAHDGFLDVKFGGPRGGKSVMFRLEFSDHLPILILTEGEWDTMLLWEHCADLCDIGTIGGAQAKFSSLDMTLLSKYLVILVVHDDDKAGGKGREYISELQNISDRVYSVTPPAHDLTDYWKSGGNLRTWTAEQVFLSLENVLDHMGPAKQERLDKILFNIRVERIKFGAS
jgi:DNA primase